MIECTSRQADDGPLHYSGKEDEDHLWRNPEGPQHPNGRQIQVVEENRNGETGILIVYPVSRLDTQKDQAEKDVSANEKQDESERGSQHFPTSYWGRTGPHDADFALPNRPHGTGSNGA